MASPSRSPPAKTAGIRRIILVSVFPEAWRERRMDESFELHIVVKKRVDVELAHGYET
jgi:hypothetical protein